MKFAKITTIMLWVFLGISLILVISLLANLDANTSDPDMGTWINANFYWLYIMFGIAIGAALILEFVNTLSDKKAGKNALIAILFMVVVIGLSYMFADNEIPRFYGVEKFIEDGTVTTDISKWIGTGLIATYILSGIAILGILWSSVSSIFK